MTSLQRAGAELLCLLLLIGLFAVYWHVHNGVEQTLGAQHCIKETTEVKGAVASDNSELVAAHAAQLSKVVAVYEQKLADSAGTNADLAQRLHDNGLRQSPIPGTGSPACGSKRDGGLPASESTLEPRSRRITDDTAAVFDACDADHAKLTIVTNAYNDWRQRMIDANAKR